MKIKQLIIVGLLAFAATSAFAGPGAPAAPAAPLSTNFIFTLPNTLTPTAGITIGQTGDFTFDIRLNFPSSPPTDVASLSYWFEVPNAFASFITITGQTITNTANGTTPFTVLAQVSPYPLSFTVLADAGFTRDNSGASGGDLGGGVPDPTTQSILPNVNSYYVSTLTFHLANAPLGTYSLQTTLNPHTSTSSSTNVRTDLPQAFFTITVVPEPATWSLLGLGGLGAVGLSVLRARRKS